MEFDKDTARFLADAYDGRDATLRRAEALRLLNPVAGQRVVDLGCGAGHLTLELSRAVGPDGRVFAIDPSEPMRSKTGDRCTGRDNVTISGGSAEASGLDAASIDGVVAIQVFSYLADLQAAVAETRRILRPGGRLVVSDIHWGGAVWRAENAELGRKVIDLWSRQMASFDVPERLPGLVQAAGFTDIEVHPVPTVDRDLRPDGLALMLMTLIEIAAGQQWPELLPEVQAWKEDQLRRAEAGDFFFAVTNFVTVARA